MGTAYSSILGEEENLRTSFGEAQAREAASDQKVVDLQRELSQAKSDLGIARDALSRAEAVGGSQDDRTAIPASSPSGGQQPTYTITDNHGNRYILSSEDYTRLHPRGLRLDEEKRALDQRSTQLDQFSQSIDEARKVLDHTDEGQVDQFNSRLESYKTASARFNEDVDLYNSEVNDFNTELERVGNREVKPTPVQ